MGFGVQSTLHQAEQSLRREREGKTFFERHNKQQARLVIDLQIGERLLKEEEVSRCLKSKDA